MLHFLSFVPQFPEVWPEDADDDRRAGTGQDFLDAFLQISKQVPVQSRVSVHDFLDLRDGGVVVDLGIKTDPEFGEVGAYDFIGDFGATDVRSEVTDAGDGPKFLADLHGDSAHGFQRSAGFFDPVHEKIAFFEVGEKLLPKPGDGDAGEEEDHRQHRDGGVGSANQTGKDAAVDPFEPAHQWRVQAPFGCTRQ